MDPNEASIAGPARSLSGRLDYVQKSSQGSLESQVYDTLDSLRKQIRVVVLCPAQSIEAEIDCWLEQSDLTNGKPYEALSYVWGAPEFTQIIRLNGAKFKITPNLEVALRNLRFADRERRLWVDAICINQANLQERSQQVAMMREIYMRCTNDLFWLGEGNAAIMKGIRFLKSKSKSPGALDIETVTTEEWFSVQSILILPAIWQRVWVVQEVSCASQVTLVCGKETLAWGLVESFLDQETYYTDWYHSGAVLGHDSGVRTTTTWTNVQIIKTQRRLFREMLGGGKSTLLDVLARFQHTKATDPRDKIYALLGLVSNTLGVEINYRQPALELFTSVTETLINFYQNLDIISQSQWALLKNPDRMKGLPSWVPDFNAPHNEYGMPVKAEFLFAQRNIFRAGDPTCSTPMSICPSGQLNISAISLGTLANYAPYSNHANMPWGRGRWQCIHYYLTTYFPSLSAPQLTTTSSQEHDPSGPVPCFANIVHTPDTYPPTHEPLFQAFWRTLTADCTAYPQARLSASAIAHDNALLRTRFLEAASGAHQRDIEIYMRFYDPRTGAFVDDAETESKTYKEIDLSCRNMLARMLDRWSFGVTDRGFLAMVPVGTVKGDEIVVLRGSKVPVVVRPVGGVGEGRRYSVVGGAYVHGVMDGEAREMVERGEVGEEVIRLV